MSSTINALTSGGGVAITGDTSGQLELKTNNGTTAVTIDTSQNVGIGTANPADIVDVTRSTSSNSNGGLTLTNTSNSGYGSALTWNMKLNSTAGNWGRINVETASSTATFMRFFTTVGSSLTEQMRIDSSGNLLVGSTSNVAAPARGAFIGNATYGGLAAEAPGSGGGYPIWFRDTDATSGSQQLVHIRRGASVVGYITTTNTTTSYQSASDYRLKEDVATMTGALAKIAQLNPVTYKWKTDGSDGQGFIAHELAEVFPDAVSGEKDAVDKENNILPQAIDQSKLVATLTAAIQELNAKVDAQAATITELQARLGA